MELLDPATEAWEKTQEKPVSAFKKLKTALGEAIMNMVPTSRKNGSSSSSNNAKKAGSSEETWERCLAFAEYEANVDPYRGIMRLGYKRSENIEEVDNSISPWRATCDWDSSSSSTTVNYVEDDACKSLVIQHCQCSCPSIILWTQQMHNKELSKRGKKKQRSADAESERFALGKRPLHATCECDFNPFCLGSLGGVMDEILEERYQKNTSPIDKRSDFFCKEEDSMASDIPAVHEIDSDSPAASQDVLRISKANVRVTKQEGAFSEFNPTKREQQDDIDSTNIYRTTTAAELKRLRKSAQIKKDLIRSYVQNILLGVPGTPLSLSEDLYMNLVCDWHKSLVFSNPLIHSSGNEEIEMALSVPPGIKNLGATCYLNTQLQCLAQNLAFLEGIFSWRPSINKNHQMNSVMSKLQALLANMIHGADCTVSTTEFSDALGLEHYEQQDPNEFARLLFERMHESFQQCSSEAKTQLKGMDNLLPSIFQGVAMYKTTCLTCHTVSERSENFMDLNLPMTQPTKASKSKAKTTALTEYLGRGVDLNLQQCLNSYACVELLNGENQYWCSQCESKSDAERVLTFQQLPPVLNVQLSRYVFDRQKLLKKKLTDPVLLPLELSVQSDCRQQQDKAGGGGSNSKYLLCAVMRHQGTSAYRGHYLAEAMDWHTGQWFEFNDDNVKLLRTGPSNSYSPSSEKQPLKNSGGKKETSVSGSQDAYNMYYVEESFLTKSVQQSILQFQQDSTKVFASGDESNACRAVTISRDIKYQLVAEMCLTDGCRSNRLQRRRNSLRQFLVSETNFHRSADPPVWVEGVLLRRFFSCSDDLESLFNSEIPMLRHKHLLCNHERPGLHPRVARKGKLLPRAVYDMYVHLLAFERAELKGDSKNVSFYERQVSDCLITPMENLFCAECSESYRRELAAKLEQVRKLKILYDELDPKKDDISGDVLPDTSPDDRYTYAISRKFITKLRAQIGTLFRSVEDVHKTQTKLSTADDTGSMLEGLDGLDLSWLQSGSFDDDEKDKLDPKVNSSITCEHGNCSVLNNRRLVRHVSFSVWQTLKSIFPDAVAHTRSRKDAEDESVDESCPTCLQGRVDKNLAEAALRSWNRETLSACSSLYKRGAFLMNDETLTKLMEESLLQDSEFRFVHKRDISGWRKALSLTKTHHDCMKAKQNIAEALLLGGWEVLDDIRDGHKECYSSELQQADILESLQIPFICKSHNHVVGPAIFESIESDGPEKLIQLINGNFILSVTEYQTYVESLMKLSSILLDFRPCDKTIPLDQFLQVYGSSYHPIIRLGPMADPSQLMKISINGCKQDVSFEHPICIDPSCMVKFNAIANERAPDIIETNNMEPYDSFAFAPLPSPRSSTGADSTDPINLDSDADEHSKLVGKIEFRIFEVEEGATLEAALHVLLQAAGLASATSETNEGNVRRSSRKRKSRYPNGAILCEEALTINLNSNIAALRLAIFEKCDGFKVNHKLTLIIPGKLEPNKAGSTEQGMDIEEDSPGIVLPHEWDHKTLKTVLAEANGSTDGKPSLSGSQHEFILLRQAERKAGTDKAYRDSLAEATMERLLEIANTSGKDSKKTTREPREKGFSGTLLLSMSAPNERTKDEDIKKPVEDSASESNADILSIASADSHLPDGVYKQHNDESKNRTALPAAKSKRRRVTVDVSDGETMPDVTDSPDMAFVDEAKKIPAIRELSDDDEEDWGNPPTTAKAHHGSKASSQSTLFSCDAKNSNFAETMESGLKRRRMFTRNTVRDELVEEVITNLMKNPELNFPDQEKCRDVVVKARKGNPGETSARTLLDISFAMMLSDQV